MPGVSPAIVGGGNNKRLFVGWGAWNFVPFLKELTLNSTPPKLSQASWSARQFDSRFLNHGDGNVCTHRPGINEGDAAQEIGFNHWIQVGQDLVEGADMGEKARASASSRSRRKMADAPLLRWHIAAPIDEALELTNARLLRL